MSELVVRRLLVDLATPLPRHWNGGDALRTAFFNALSMSFPVGEQVFIESVKGALPRLTGPQRERFEAEARAFIGQEATHRRIHTLFNEHLARQGLVNHWEARILRRNRRLEGVDIRGWLAVTAATEHLTALLAEHLLHHPAVLEGAEERLRKLWLWHACEENEHRCTAFDLYRALGGNEKWRRRLFLLVTWYFITDVTRQTAHNLWRDGTWWRPATWASAWRLLFGRSGLVRCQAGAWRRYLDGDFHPSQADGRAAQQWLAAHADLAPPVRG